MIEADSSAQIEYPPDLKPWPTSATFNPPQPPSPPWAVYNRAQREEITLFDDLLRELVKTVPDPVQRGRGRPRLSRQEVLFCAIQKVYSQLSSRRAHSLFRNAEDREQIGHAPHYNAVSKALLKDEMTPILKEMVHRTAMPLTAIEKDFAADSSGFTTTCFGSYCDHKHKGKRKHKYLKAHIMSGVKTNIVTDIVVTDDRGADSPQFKELVRNTAMFFDVDQISADKAYLSRANLDAVEDVGGRPFIPFKSNSVHYAKGSKAWSKAYHFFHLHRDSFERIYHKRSNVETTFGAIKRKFGESVKSKKFVAQVNELLCKIIAYNITVLVKAMFEFGIDLNFGLTLQSNN